MLSNEKFNINIVINELLDFLESDYYKKKYPTIDQSIKLGLILHLFKFKNLNILKKNHNFKKLQNIGVDSIKNLKTKTNEWKDSKDRIKALNLQLSLLIGKSN